jgi:hypothetical protein
VRPAQPLPLQSVPALVILPYLCPEEIYPLEAWLAPPRLLALVAGVQLVLPPPLVAPRLLVQPPPLLVLVQPVVPPPPPVLALVPPPPLVLVQPVVLVLLQPVVLVLVQPVVLVLARRRPRGRSCPPSRQGQTRRGTLQCRARVPLASHTLPG